MIVFCLIQKSQAEDTTAYIAPKVQIHYGFGDMHDTSLGSSSIKMNPGIGGGVLFGYKLMESLAVEGALSFAYWITDTPSGLEYTSWMIPIQLGVNYNIIPILGIIGGAGFTYWNIEAEILGYTVSSSTTKFSLYAGAEVLLGNVFIRPYLLYVMTSDASAQLVGEVGYKFNF